MVIHAGSKFSNNYRLILYTQKTFSCLSIRLHMGGFPTLGMTEIIRPPQHETCLGKVFFFKLRAGLKWFCTCAPTRRGLHARGFACMLATIQQGTGVPMPAPEDVRQLIQLFDCL